MESVAVI